MSTTDNQTNMTAEEAIKILQEDNCVDCGYETESYAKCNFTGDCKVRTAMSMAVEALKTKPCTDAVSRQAVLDLINADWKYEGLETDVENLPSVMPQPKIGHWILLKDAYGDVIEAVCSNCDKNGNHEWSLCPYCGAIMVKSQESEEA